MPSPVVIAEPGLTTLLVVDDSVFDHQVIARLLQVVEGLRVIFASGGKEAMQTLDRELPQLILTDLIMPDMDGLELVQQVRHRFPPIPMILMTAFGSEEAAMRALRAGAANYIPKKDLARDLVETVRSILRMSTVDRHRRRLLHCLNCRESTFLLENDPNLIASLLELVQEELDGLGACPNICSCSRMAAGFRWALAFSASAQPCARTIPLNRPRRCRSGARSSKDCGSSISVATRPTLSPGLAIETCGFPART